MGDVQDKLGDANLQITKKTNRSWYMFMLQHLIKPFNTSIIRPRKAFPAGSNQLTPHRNASKRCNITERKVEEIYIYDMTPKSRSATENGETKTKRLYYFCGGAWQMHPSSQHWGFCAEMACRLPSTKISVVSYPLAPNSPAPMSFPRLLRMYKRVLEEAEEAGEQVILAGDSSGGNIVLCLVLATLAEDRAAKSPTAVLVVSPSCDLRDTNPASKEVEKHDPILRVAFSQDNGNKWRGSWSADDPHISPIMANVSLLSERGVKLYGVTGGYDILSPDALLFRDKCIKADVSGEWLVWEKQMHCFPLAWGYRLPESVEAKEWILDVLRRS